MSESPWDIYAQQLFPLGYGHPLWVPEPAVREVEIGDVGWLKDGELRGLFNSMRPADDPANAEMGVPPEFRMLNPQNVSISTLDKITPPRICSRSIHDTDRQMDLAGGARAAPVALGTGFGFKASSDTGAFVMLEPPGQSRDIESKRHIVNYMRENFDHWYEFANADNSWGLSLRDQDILFVCGTIKTTRWAVAAFHGDLKNKTGYVSGEFGPYATANISVNVSNQILPINYYRHGPRSYPPSRAPKLTYPSHAPPQGPQSGPNQCIFIHYYKMKRRLSWSQPMQAAGGWDDQLPPGGWGLGNAARSWQYDPVNYLLDFIFLRSPEAEIAIASDLDLIAIFSGGDFPADMPAALEELSPQIEVDENGVGTIAVQHQFRRPNSGHNEDTVKEVEMARAKRARQSPDHDTEHLDSGIDRDEQPSAPDIPMPAEFIRDDEDIQMGYPDTQLNDDDNQPEQGGDALMDLEKRPEKNHPV